MRGNSKGGAGHKRTQSLCQSRLQETLGRSCAFEMSPLISPPLCIPEQLLERCNEPTSDKAIWAACAKEHLLTAVSQTMWGQVSTQQAQLAPPSCALNW